MSEDDDAEEPLTSAGLRARAARYREIAKNILDQRTIDALLSLAAEFEKVAEQMEQR